MKNLLILSVFLMIAAFAVAQEKPAPSSILNPSEAAVNQVVIDLFDGMREGDSAKVHRCFHQDVTLFTSYTSKKGEKVLKNDGGLQKFLDAVGTPHDEIWDEKLRNTKIHIDGNLAQVWTEYAFYLGDKFSHCGIDAFLLTNTSEGWKILNLADTRRRSDCDWE